MLRWTIAIILAVVAIEPAVSADKTPAHRRWHRAAVMLPAGLPRSHYAFRTTIAYDKPYPASRSYAHRIHAYEPPDILFTPEHVGIAYIQPWIGAPLLPGGPTLPGYYGTALSSYSPGPYYGDGYTGYWDRLPYACGVYGTC
jgi:hypothetical protein